MRSILFLVAAVFIIGSECSEKNDAAVKTSNDDNDCKGVVCTGPRYCYHGKCVHLSASGPSGGPEVPAPEQPKKSSNNDDDCKGVVCTGARYCCHGTCVQPYWGGPCGGPKLGLSAEQPKKPSNDDCAVDGDCTGHLNFCCHGKCLPPWAGNCPDRMSQQVESNGRLPGIMKALSAIRKQSSSSDDRCKDVDCGSTAKYCCNGTCITLWRPCEEEAKEPKMIQEKKTTHVKDDCEGVKCTAPRHCCQGQCVTPFSGLCP